MELGKRFILSWGIILLGLVLNVINVEASENHLVRISFNPVEGFTDVEDRVYSGDAFDYLREIAKYTGWEYEFIELAPNEILEQLENGEVEMDLIL